LNFIKPPPLFRCVSFRKPNPNLLADLRNKVTNIEETISSTSNAKTAFSSFNNHQSIAIDEYAPYSTKTYKIYVQIHNGIQQIHVERLKQ
jgi:hypothetical protein